MSEQRMFVLDAKALSAQVFVDGGLGSNFRIRRHCGLISTDWQTR